ncbi:MAG: M20/M25/M40 family metallo-hydrolase [Gemmatimonadales bacterium]|nr:M20/M25/M40 family metallo-hydrolase [Gemmatimonadales bacterium]
MKTTPLLALALALPLAPLDAQTATTPRAQRILSDIRYLASDSLGGRYTGSPGNDSAAAYLARRFRQIGLAPGGDGGTYLQAWTVGNTTGTRQAGVDGRATKNVVGILRGSDPRLAGQDIVIGAHFDHLGLGPFGSLAPDSAGQVHNGADDNASGTAAVLEVARVLAATRPRLARTIVFVLFSGEEEGILGSAYYTDHPAMPMDSMLAMLNFDMVGRMRNNRLLALGSRTATEWDALLDSVNARAHLDVRASGDGWGPSDHASFFAKHRPVLHFFTDLHEDYHRPSDDWEKINADGIVAVADFAADLTRRLAARPSWLTFVDAPPPAAPVAGTGERPYLGTIPDMTDEPGGVRLSGVRSGSPAEAAGLREGDVLTAIGDLAIANLQDFQNALVAHRPGDRVEVRFKRGDRTQTATVILGRRS